MPHAIVEWTDNLEPEGFAIRPLLQAINAEMRDSDGAFPTGGIRVRGIKLTDYVVADDAHDYAFVNVTFKIGAGRDDAFKTAFFDRMFEVIKAQLKEIYERRPLAISLYVEELDGGLKHNNIHQMLKAKNP